MTKIHLILSLCICLIFLSSEAIQAGSIAWPVIHEKSGSLVFNKPAEADFTTDIKDLDGRPLYVLRCRSGDMDDVGDFNYSGLLQCRLSVINAPQGTPSTLLWEDLKVTSDWDGRGRFMLNDIIGTCGSYPDWGSTRNYLVRGMRLTLKIENIRLLKLENGEVVPTSFVFSYAVKHDFKATSALTKKSAEKEPAWFSGGEQCLGEVRATL